MNSNGYAIVRLGILDHLVVGRLGFFEMGIYTTILLQADFHTGIWWGSAPRLLATCPRGTSLRRVQQAIKTLVDIGFLRPSRVHGKRGNYPVLIDKYDIKLGALKGKRLNARKSRSWESPCYEDRTETDTEVFAERFTEACTDDAPNQESIVKKQKTRTTDRRSAPVGGSSVDDGFEQFYSAYPKKKAKKAAQAAWRKLRPEDRSAAIAALDPLKRSEDWLREGGRFIPHPSSFLNGHRWEDEISAPSNGANGGSDETNGGNHKSAGGAVHGPVGKYDGLKPHFSDA